MMAKKMNSNPDKKRLSVFFLWRFIFYFLLILSLIALCIVINIVFINPDSSLDNLVFSFVKSYINPVNTRVMVFFTTLGNYEIVLFGNIMLFLFLFLVKKQKMFAIRIALVALGGLFLMYILKGFFERPRPDFPLLVPALGFSFPSGHSLNSLIFYGLVVYICWIYLNNKILKLLISVILITTILLIGVSRIYIGVHYFTDVVAGFSIGIIWLFCWIGMIDRFRNLNK